ncbi:MAG: hypothetical protein GF398_21205 [Chitinivibrionales bacterium]|nr:hypothetical protein [Chitinivibrionales bacterium]
MDLPKFPPPLRKNDGLFLYGATQHLPWVFAYEQDRVEVIHGPACKPEKEINLDLCDQDKVPVIKRRGGGGTVVLSPGMVITIVAGLRRREDSIASLFSRIHLAMISLLGEYASHLAIQEKGLSDLAIDGKKVLGSSLYLSQRPLRYYYQSSLMVDSELQLIERYLHHPPKEPQYRGARPHLEFCTTLSRENAAQSTSGIVSLFNRELKQRLVEWFDLGHWR